LLDPDDEFMPYKLKEQVDFMDSHPEVHMVYGTAIVYNEFGKRIDSTGQNFRDVNLRYVNPIPFQSVMLLSWVYLQENGCDTRLKSCEDWDLWVRLHNRYNIHFMDRPMYILHHHKGQLSRTVADREEYTKRVQWENNSGVKRLLLWGSQYSYDRAAFIQASMKNNLNIQVYGCDYNAEEGYISDIGYVSAPSMCNNINPDFVIFPKGIKTPKFSCEMLCADPDIFSTGEDLFGSYLVTDSVLSKYKSFILERMHPCEFKV
jgi:hypothetical protein